MANVSIGDVDLNLLPVLHAMLEERSVVGAARHLHRSPAAVSRSLGRLRRALDDPLFVRSGRDLVATPRALALQADVCRALEQVHTVFGVASDVDPALLSRRFRVSAGDTIIAAMGLQILHEIRRAAPGVSIDFVSDANEAEQLRTGDVDLDLGPNDDLAGGLETEQLFDDQIVVVVRRDHPLTTKPVTARRYAAAEHLVVSQQGERREWVDAVLGERNLVRSAAFTVPSYTVAAQMIAKTDLVMLAPSAVVGAFAAEFGLCSVDVPFATPSVRVSQTWHSRLTNDAAHQWLRASVAEAAQQVVADIRHSLD